MGIASVTVEAWPWETTEPPGFEGGLTGAVALGEDVAGVPTRSAGTIPRPIEARRVMVTKTVTTEA